MGVVLVAVLLAQAPSLSVLTTRRTGATPTEGVQVATEIAELLQHAGVPVSLSAAAAANKLADMGTRDAGICQGKKACIAELQRQLDVQVLVAVSVGKLKSDTGVNVEAVRLSDGSTIATESVLVATGAKLESAQLEVFVARLREALGLALKQPVLTPRDERPIVVAPVPPPSQPEPTHTAGIALAATAGACAVATVVLAVLAANANAQRTCTDGDNWCYSPNDHQAWSRRTNGLISAAIGTGSGALVLGTGAVFAW